MYDINSCTIQLHIYSLIWYTLLLPQTTVAEKKPCHFCTLRVQLILRLSANVTTTSQQSVFKEFQRCVLFANTTKRSLKAHCFKPMNKVYSSKSSNGLTHTLYNNYHNPQACAKVNKETRSTKSSDSKMRYTQLRSYSTSQMQCYKCVFNTCMCN